MDNKFVLSQSFNDLVFEKRNKKYGAYDIRRKYGRFALLAGACAILFFTTGSLTWAYVQTPEKEHNFKIVDVNITPPVIQPLENKDEVKPEVPKPVVPQQATSAAELGPKTPDMTSDVNIVDDATPPPSNLDAGKDPNGIVGGIGSGPEKKGDSVVVIADPPRPTIVEWSNHPPTCAGLDTYLAQNIRYPDICREQGIEGTVYVQFIVDTKGDYRDVQVVKGPHPAMNKEALRVMSTMPKWTPATDDNGVLVEYIMRKPIRFELTK